MVIPAVVGCRLIGKLQPGVMTTDLALTVTKHLREQGVIGKWVEFNGPGVKALRLAERATLSNMACDYGATKAFFPLDEETLRYLELTGRRAEDIALAEAYAKAQGLWREAPADAVFSDALEIDLGASRRCPARVCRRNGMICRTPQPAFCKASPTSKCPPPADAPRAPGEVREGDVVIGAITSCTNTSNPKVLVAAGGSRRARDHRGEF